MRPRSLDKLLLEFRESSSGKKGEIRTPGIYHGQEVQGREGGREGAH